MDFTSDELLDGRRIRLLTIVDNFTRESLAIEVDSSLGGHRVVEVLQRLAQQHRLPKTIRVDNGPEFISRVLDQWAYLNKVELDFSRPGKPTDNAYIEAFNARFRQECLNENWFLSLEDAREKTKAWRQCYNSERPHGALGNLTSKEFISNTALAEAEKARFTRDTNIMIGTKKGARCSNTNFLGGTTIGGKSTLLAMNEGLS
jgi:putative transposase